jgi:hypothetical protein
MTHEANPKFHVETVEGYDELSEHDQKELRLFETYLRGRAAQKAGEAIDAPDLLYAVVYGQDDGGAVGEGGPR